MGLHLRLVRQRQTQWSNLWVRNRPCAALKATCTNSTRGTVTHHFQPMEIKVKEFLNKPVFWKYVAQTRLSCRFLKNLNQKDLNKHPCTILQDTYYKRTMLRKWKINLRKAKILGHVRNWPIDSPPKMASNSSDSLYLSLSRIKSKKVEYTSPIYWF